MYFGLMNNGKLICLPDSEDIEEAEEESARMGVDCFWLFDEYTAKGYADFMTTKLDTQNV